MSILTSLGICIPLSFNQVRTSRSEEINSQYWAESRSTKQCWGLHRWSPIITGHEADQLLSKGWLTYVVLPHVSAQERDNPWSV